MITNFDRHTLHALDPKLNRPKEYKNPSTPKLATNPVVARIRKQDFQPNLNVKQVKSTGSELLSKAPTVKIKRIG